MWKVIKSPGMLRAFSQRHLSNQLKQRHKLDVQDFKEGSEIEGFIVKQVEEIPEFNITLMRLKHERTGCEHLHLARDDPNNVFSVGFRTTPTDSTGVPHILEHSVLCGSKKYPCRDPFFKMLNRSMATFMNAMTAPDCTFYPFSTQNRTDYMNLMSVYMDAVYRPLLRETDFRQEGWRLEHENVEDSKSPIILKGVVYNEMKGVFSDNRYVFHEALQNNLMPSHTYGVVSGGHPLDIPNLTYENFKAFHHKYYHPSNCSIYSYGNFPLADTLGFINSEYLAKYPDVTDYSKGSEVPPEPRWKSEIRKHVTCRPDPMAPDPAKQSTITVATLCNDIREIQETFEMQVLGELLVGGPNSSFYKTLVEPNIGAGYSPVTGYDPSTRDTVFAVGLSAVNPADFDRIVDIYHSTLKKVIEEGFEEDNINGILHNIELNTKHQSASFGLNLLFHLISIWNHNGDIGKAMQVNSKVEVFKKKMASNPRYLQDLVKRQLLDTNHRLVITMSPDEKYIEKLADKEKTILENKLKDLTPERKKEVYDFGLKLKKDQDTKQNVDVLPTLKVSDLSKDVERTSLNTVILKKVPIQLCNVPTNGVTYVRGVINTSGLPEEAKRYLPIFCSVITRMGTEKFDYKEFDKKIQLKTGGLSISSHIAGNIFDNKLYEDAIIFSSMSLNRNVKDMMSLWSEIFNEVSYKDMQRFETLVKMIADGAIQSIASSGHHYAMSKAASFTSRRSARQELQGGLEYVETMKSLSSSKDLGKVLDIIKTIGDSILNKKYLRIAVNTDSDAALGDVGNFLTSINGECTKGMEKSEERGVFKSQDFFYEMPFQVSYVGKSLPTTPYVSNDHPALRVAAKLLSSQYLLPTVREKGGAYGAGASLAPSGTFSFYSYRDPQPQNTLKTFESCKDWLASGTEYSERNIEEAKLGVFQAIDAPISPGDKGLQGFLYGVSDDILMKHRRQIMRVTKEDIQRVSKLLDSPIIGTCVIGPKSS
uniref:Presequence protease, mitochondrial n=2 Tax=Lygus hesperus TaxID=30085 RepID=A0A0A9X823_LYGHE